LLSVPSDVCGMRLNKSTVGHASDVKPTQETTMVQLEYSVMGYHYSRRIVLLESHRETLINGKYEDACNLIRKAFIQYVDGSHHISEVLALTVDGRELLPFSAHYWADGVQAEAMKNLAIA